MTITSGSKRPSHIRMGRPCWRAMLRELAARGESRRESGAFLLGQRRGRRPRVTYVVYFDDLEPESLNGAVHLTTTAYSRLWVICRERGIEVLADVHTHPGGCVQQSEIDEENPLVGQRGHIAIIIGHFAQKIVSLREVGIYEYHGDDGWEARPRAVSHGRW